MIGGFIACVVGSTTVRPLIEKFRINVVEVFGPMNSNLVPVTVKLDWNSLDTSFSSSSKKYSDTSIGASVGAHLSVAPDQESLASKWISTRQAFNVFTIDVPVQAIVDISVDIVLLDSDIPLDVKNIVAGPAVGTLGTMPPPSSVSLGLPSLL